VVLSHGYHVATAHRGGNGEKPLDEPDEVISLTAGGNHDWVVDEFDAATDVISAGATDTIQFVADQTVEFEYFCSAGSHRQQGMYGTLIGE